MTKQYIRGFTLVELMIIVAILAIITVVAVPTASRMSKNQLSDRLYQELQLDLRYARSHASTTARQIRFEPVASWQQGWQIVDQTDNRVIRKRSHTLDAGLISSADISSATPLIFAPDGSSNADATLVINVPGCTGLRVRSLMINRIGQIQISGSSLCP